MGARSCYTDCRAQGNGWRRCCGTGGGAVCGAYGDGCRSVRALQERATEEGRSTHDSLYIYGIPPSAVTHGFRYPGRATSDIEGRLERALEDLESLADHNWRYEKQTLTG